MNKHALYHLSESSFCYPLDLKRALITFRTARDDADIKEIYILYNMSAYFPRKRHRMKMKRIRSDELYDYYEAILDLEIPSYMYYFEIKDINNKKYYYLETGLTEKVEQTFFGMLAFRLPFINKSNALLTKEKFQGNVVYQIFPERFLMGDNNKDKSYINQPWNSLKLRGTNFNHTVFLGGDLQGVINKLDYIKDLGVDILYITPVTASPSNHKYNITNYYEIDPMFGSNSTYKKLVELAHQKGLKVIMDLVFNHTSDQHPFYQDVLKNGKASKYYDFYCMQEEKLKTDGLLNYTFNSCRYMPKLNTNNPEVMKYCIDVCKFYLNEFDVDGFRLDVANEVAHLFWINFNQELRKIKPDLYIIGENWDNAHEYLKGYEFDGIMNYTFFTICWQYFISNSLSTKQFVDRLNSLLIRYPRPANEMSFTLLDSHDTCRFYNCVKDDKDLYVLAYVLMVSYIGMPMIYYGDEIFMMGGSDPDNRRGMRWDSKEFKSPYHKLFKDILHLRKIEVFRSGDIDIYEEDGLIKIMRSSKYKKVLIIINKNKCDKMISETGKVLLANRFKDKQLLSNGFVVLEK